MLWRVVTFDLSRSTSTEDEDGSRAYRSLLTEHKLFIRPTFSTIAVGVITGILSDISQPLAQATKVPLPICWTRQHRV